MSPLPTKRLSKAERREQLLETALAIVRDEGTEALTLGYLAERAGVTKPIAYEHFGSRSGLLMALYQHFDEEQVSALVRALGRAPERLEDVVQIVSRAYMHCSASMGPEWGAIAAALQGTGEMAIFHQTLLDGYAEFYGKVFAPFVKYPREELRLRCVAIIGAAEALAHDMSCKRVSEARARKSLATLISAILGAERVG